MRLGLFRLTIRRSMILVAIVATVMGAGLAVKRLIALRADYHKRAIGYGREESNARVVLSHLEELRAGFAGAVGPIADPPMDPATRAQLIEEMKSDPEFRKTGINPEMMGQEGRRPQDHKFLKRRRRSIARSRSAATPA